MSVSANTLRRVAALRLSAAAFREVLSIIADVQAEYDEIIRVTEDRKRRDRERKTPPVSAEVPWKPDGTSGSFPEKSDGISTGNAAEIPETRQSLSSFLPSTGEPLKEGSASKEVCGGRAKKYDETFENSFWKPYPRTAVMSKKEAFTAWLRTSPEDQSKACSAIDSYKRFLNDKPDHPVVHACRFLSQRRFDGFVEAAPSDDGRPPNVPDDIPPEQWQDYLGGWRPGMITSRQRKEQHDAYERALNGGVDNSQELSPAGIVVRQITEGQAQ